MPVCSVITCKFSQEHHDAAAEGIVFHKFPKNDEIRAKWVDMTGLDDWVPTSKDHICSRHFRDSDYFIKRSGKRYLKTAAIPCEYVVYRHLFPDEEVVEVKVEVNEDDASEEEAENLEQGPNVVVIHEPEQEFHMELAGPSRHDMQDAEPNQEPEASRDNMQEDDPTHEADPSNNLQDADPVQNLELSFYDMQDADPTRQRPGPSRRFAHDRRDSFTDLPDSTIVSGTDMQNAREWERFRPEHYYAERLPASIFEDNSQEVDSSGIDEQYHREEGLSMNPYPPDFDMRPHLQQLPPPRTPEPVLPILDERESNSEPVPDIGQMPEPVHSANVELVRGQKKLESIRKIMTRRKSSKKAVAAAIAEVIEAQNIKTQLQSGELMTEYEKAAAIIALQNKRIVKLDMKRRKLKKILKRISAVLRDVDGISSSSE